MTSLMETVFFRKTAETWKRIKPWENWQIHSSWSHKASYFSLSGIPTKNHASLNEYRRSWRAVEAIIGTWYLFSNFQPTRKIESIVEQKARMQHVSQYCRSQGLWHETFLPSSIHLETLVLKMFQVEGELLEGTVTLVTAKLDWKSNSQGIGWQFGLSTTKELEEPWG